jgi:hypothetical protein
VKPPSVRAAASTWIGSFQSRGRIVGDSASPAADLTLVTSDERLLGSRRIATLANR